MYFLIIEHDPIWQSKIQVMLEDLPDATIEFVETYEAASLAITKTLPDLILTDVVLPDGISFKLFNTLSSTYPIIFFTEFPEDEYFKQALSFPNATFLVKPFHRFTLQGAIHCVTNKTQFLPKPEPIPLREEGIWVNDKYRQKILVHFKEITYMEGEGNYVTIHTANERQYVLKTSLRKVLYALDTQFVQIQKGFILNRNFINRIDISAGQVNVKGSILPIGRTFQKDLLAIISEQST